MPRKKRRKALNINVFRAFCLLGSALYGPETNSIKDQGLPESIDQGSNFFESLFIFDYIVFSPFLDRLDCNAVMFLA